MYDALEDIVLPEAREHVLSILEERGVPLEYANTAARIAFDYSVMLDALGMTREEAIASHDLRVPLDEPQWYAAVSFAILVAGYYDAGHTATDFHPFVMADKVPRVKEAGHTTQAIGHLVMTTPSRKRGAEDIYEDALSLPPEWLLIAIGDGISLSMLKDTYDWGFREIDLCLCSERGTLFYHDLHMYSQRGYDVKVVTEAIRAFARFLVVPAIELGMSAEQIREYYDSGKPLPLTGFDLKRIMNPGVPDEYIRAMYEGT